MTLTKRISMLILAFIMGLSPVMAAPFDPSGYWEAVSGESRYKITLCGDGTQLCAELIWIRPDVKDARNSAYLNTYVVEAARRHSDREWRGKVNIFGFIVDGNVQRLNDSAMQVRGCLLIICEKQQMVRIPDDVALASN